MDTERFTTRNERKIKEYKNKYGIKDNDFVVIFAGRLVDEKGALETIKAIKECKDEHIKLLIVGAGFYSSDIVDDYTLELQKEAEGIKDRIVFTGYGLLSSVFPEWDCTGLMLQMKNFIT